MRLKLIGCRVLLREMCDACAHSPHGVDLELLPAGLHGLGGKAMAAKIQEAVDRTPEGAYDAILLGYGLCGNGLDGLTARYACLVAPRAHDCIALLMGSRERYQAYFEGNPGTYYRSTGWLKRGRSLRRLAHHAMGVEDPLAALAGKYGEDDGRYLYAELTRYRSRYGKLTYIETGLEPGPAPIAEAAAEAADKGWSFERLPGDLAWLRRLVAGEWAETGFVVAGAGQRIVASHDAGVLKVQW